LPPGGFRTIAPFLIQFYHSRDGGRGGGTGGTTNSGMSYPHGESGSAMGPKATAAVPSAVDAIRASPAFQARSTSTRSSWPQRRKRPECRDAFADHMPDIRDRPPRPDVHSRQPEPHRTRTDHATRRRSDPPVLAGRARWMRSLRRDGRPIRQQTLVEKAVPGSRATATTMGDVHKSRLP